MKKMKFKCTLLTDVILNVKSATEGSNKTLDFIPGNCFLGIVASGNGYTELEKLGMAWEIFHSGTVRFGDAHPAINDIRSLRVPASMFYPKMKKASEVCYIHHFYDRFKDNVDNGGPQQLKQCRNGFYGFVEEGGQGIGYPSKNETHYAIKSAFDTLSRRSEDEAMYGYQSLGCGQEFFFDVEIDNDNHADIIKKSLCGEKHIGRSRTSQYGLVSIEPADYREVSSGGPESGYVSVYADGRLIFFDRNGLPTFRPTASDLGLTSGEVVGELSQIRTFQYAPWNFKRQAYDADRCGIEKGSVFIIKGCKDAVFTSGYVGHYRTEGFGKVIYNPVFLKADLNSNGTALFKLSEVQDSSAKGAVPSAMNTDECNTPLLRYVNLRILDHKNESHIYTAVSDFVNKYSHLFSDMQFASQWGTIRSIVTGCRTYEEIMYKLFEKEFEKVSGKGEKKDIAYAYLTHGIASKKWEERGRREKLQTFLTDLRNGENKTDDKSIRLILIYLASEMAKKCKK